MMWMNKSVKYFTVIIASALVLFTTANAQVTINQSIDIAGGINDSTIQWSAYPEINWNTINKIFDGNGFTEAGVSNSDTLAVTLMFSSSINISKVKVIFFNDGIWSLESANSLSDLNNKTGSYQLDVNNMKDTAFVWDSLEFASITAQFIRLSAKNLSDTSVYIGELSLQKNVKLTKLVMIPYPPKLIPGTTLKTHLKVEAENGSLMDYNLNYPVVYHSSDESIATVDASGNITGIGLGNCTISVSTESGSLKGEAPAQVVTDFVSQRAPARIVKVALIYQDPVVDSATGERLHQKFNWNDPDALVAQLIQEFKNVTDGMIQFKIVEKHDDQQIFTKLDSTFITVKQLVNYYNEPGWTTIKSLVQDQGRVKFDYNAMLNYYNLCAKRDSGTIDEVWVYAHPFAAMYESILTGAGAFWWNAPPLTGNSCKKLLSIMGWNYERGVAEAMHSFGHRVESAMWHAYGSWNDKAADPNMWDLFTRIDKDVPGGANIGNVHYPPNGQSDYDYGDSKAVTTFADNWKRYPYLLDQHRTVTCSEWGCSQLGYMRWFFNHLPRYTGVYNGILNNWWAYALDYNSAVDSAKAESVITDVRDKIAQGPAKYILEQNYPNPFNPTTTIKYRVALPGHVTLRIYDILGRVVSTLIDQNKRAGDYAVTWNGRNGFNNAVASGIYFYRLSVNDFIKTKKMILLK